MVKLQLDLSEKEDYIIQVFKVKNKLKTKQEAVKKIIEMNSSEF